MNKLKTILGLDLGTNSIGWALIKKDSESKKVEIKKIKIIDFFIYNCSVFL